jgi:hypothetical protein
MDANNGNFDQFGNLRASGLDGHHTMNNSTKRPVESSAANRMDQLLAYTTTELDSEYRPEYAPKRPRLHDDYAAAAQLDNPALTTRHHHEWNPDALHYGVSGGGAITAVAALEDNDDDARIAATVAEFRASYDSKWGQPSMGPSHHHGLLTEGNIETAAAATSHRVDYAEMTHAPHAYPTHTQLEENDVTAALSLLSSPPKNSVAHGFGTATDVSSLSGQFEEKPYMASAGAMRLMLPKKDYGQIPESEIEAKVAASVALVGFPETQTDPDRLLAIRSIVTGSPNKVKAAPVASATTPAVKNEAAADDPFPSKSKKSKSKKEKLLDNKKPIQERVLAAKKETTLATNLLRGKGDLADCLPREDCLLLGRLWIFTVQQLMFALAAYSNQEGQEFYDDIVSVLAHSKQMSAPVRVSTSATDAPHTPNPDVGVPVSDNVMLGGVPDESENVGGSASLSAGLHEAANEKINRWSTVVAEFAKKGVPKPLDQTFRFDGAIQILFPPSFLNFLRSINMRTLWNFMSTRKTEAGAMCELMTIWRRECGLSQIPHLGLARHILAAGCRVEAALAALPSVPKEDRIWMKDPIFTMTGAARDFLVHDQRIFSAFEFVSMRTKDVSMHLEGELIRTAVYRLWKSI